VLGQRWFRCSSPLGTGLWGFGHAGFKIGIVVGIGLDWNDLGRKTGTERGATRRGDGKWTNKAMKTYRNASFFSFFFLFKVA
jgi:hypothetical protein